MDGWCAARGFDPAELSTPRLLNLALIVALDWRPDARSKQEFLDALELAAEAADRVPAQLGGASDGAPPGWWDEDAGAEALTAARRMGVAR